MAKGHVSKLLLPAVLVLILIGVVLRVSVVNAVSAPSLLYISEVQVSDTEFIELYNPQTVAISLSGWQVKYRGSGATENALKVFAVGETIPAKGHVLLTKSYIAPVGVTAYPFTTALANSGGYVALYDSSAVRQDIVGWGTAGDKFGTATAAPTAEKSIQRCLDGGLLRSFEPRDNSLEFSIYTITSPGAGINCPIIELPDVCFNITGLQEAVPDGYTVDSNGNCNLIIVHNCAVEISEISSQPNFSGQEYIEVINNSSEDADLILCTIKINGGSYKVFPDVVLTSGLRYVLLFASGTIRNSAGQVNLTQSGGSDISYIYGETVSGQTINFNEGNQSGVVSDKPTPGAPNEFVLLGEEELTSVASGSVRLEGCPVGKYRNPDTNRCKNLEALATALEVCLKGQERNAETNRCRKISTATTLSACEEGQERNSATNRCRKIGTLASDLQPCEVGQERNPETNRCRKVATVATGTALAGVASPAAINPFKFKVQIISALVVLLLAYGIYEYKTDIRVLIQKIIEKKKIGKPPN